MEIKTKTESLIDEWKNELKEKINCFNSVPSLLIIMAKDYSEPSKIYVNNKIKLGKELGINVKLCEVEWKDKIKDELLTIIKENIMLNSCSGVIVQLPFPQLTEEEIKTLIPPSKDVDGFTNEQKGLLVSGSDEALIPCTALGVMKLLEYVHGNLSRKTIAIVNRSNLIGKPLMHLALQRNMTPIILHTKSSNFIKSNAIATSEIVVTGCGKRKLFNHEHFNSKFTKTIIDCSMDRVKDIPGVGDCDKEDILEYMPHVNIASGYGYTGPLTVLGLFENVVKAHEIWSR